jgi:hypothetical protein
MARKTSTPRRTEKTVPAAVMAAPAPAKPAIAEAPVKPVATPLSATRAPAIKVVAPASTPAAKPQGTTLLGTQPTTTEAKVERPRPTPVTDQQIALRAYELFLARGGRPGNPVADWLQAERELRGNGRN